jgi:hypothetical protein
MKKTSVYLEDEDVSRLRRLAEREGKSQARVLREALAAYDADLPPDRNFALSACFEGDGTSIADIPDEELMKGFGEDSFGE